jgi:hypothetical protein
MLGRIVRDARIEAVLKRPVADSRNVPEAVAVS